jgi:2-succinyl-6-hydroxy-2,4-cyclohexadiene-1-carboxylate synthase
MRALGLGRMPDLGGHLAGARVPLCFVAGERDAKFAALLPRLAAAGGALVETRVVPGCGHNAALEAPAALADIVRDLAAAPAHGAAPRARRSE